MEHHQTIARTPWHPRLVGNCLVCIYQFLISNSIFKTLPNLQNFLFPPYFRTKWSQDTLEQVN